LESLYSSRFSADVRSAFEPFAPLGAQNRFIEPLRRGSNALFFGLQDGGSCVHDPGGPSGEGAPPGDPDYQLHTELGEETKRLATHPREEAHRLVEELREGETETTPLIALSGLALWLLVAIVIALVFLIARLRRSSRGR
jgi:hypothetical protein